MGKWQMIKKWVKIIALVCIIGVVLIYLILFAINWQEMRKEWKHTFSSSVGLQRTITEQDCNRNPVKTWTGRFKIEIVGSSISFIDNNGKEVKVSPPYLVEEL